MAEFAANAAQGHIGRAKYLATNEEARKTREKILSIPFKVNDLASAFAAANTLVELAKSQALAESEVRDEAELTKLKESYGTTGSKLATGGSKAVKELEKDQKTRATRSVRDNLEGALLDIATVFRDILLVQSGSKDHLINSNLRDQIMKQASISQKETNLAVITTILKLREDLSKNTSSILVTEALISKLINY
jgi:DNA polymerase-3 subunit delta'